MFARLTLLAATTLLLSACDGNPLQTAAQKACCCNHCPDSAAPAATPKAPAAKGRRRYPHGRHPGRRPDPPHRRRSPRALPVHRGSL
jgi:hypothetical protein